MAANGLPAAGHAAAAFPGCHSRRFLQAFVKPGEAFKIRVKSVQRAVNGEKGVMVAAFPIFGFVVDNASFNLDLTCIEIALEVEHIILRVP
ncbi:hypothetical protein SDC9_182486 [bioreactor metagenome]|uniref:Uncharacterized protein n=1 Tax=bioreactor metagenome TaxID=1076179 RepID=A0A645H9E8_9ZZZZ